MTSAAEHLKCTHDVLEKQKNLQAFILMTIQLICKKLGILHQNNRGSFHTSFLQRESIFISKYTDMLSTLCAVNPSSYAGQSSLLHYVTAKPILKPPFKRFTLCSHLTPTKPQLIFPKLIQYLPTSYLHNLLESRSESLTSFIFSPAHQFCPSSISRLLVFIKTMKLLNYLLS